ncbi:hypothetical protein SAY87_016806 [Trapa incisa]|uniref:Uncharacterized protein n=1 Tax=Trapa incisa TaxID=236973 RepID=A0AAN7LGC4_9MYRT|nr:hypothetical protein SAY87_016806 [Trapa incisa]
MARPSQRVVPSNAVIISGLAMILLSCVSTKALARRNSIVRELLQSEAAAPAPASVKGPPADAPKGPPAAAPKGSPAAAPDSADSALAAGAPSGAKGPVVDVTAFGAKPNDPSFDNAKAFMQAWGATCKGTGTNKLLIPSGEYIAGQTVFQGPCKGPITVEVLGTVKAVADVTAYADEAWISFEAITGIMLKGGVFDAQGATVWKYNDCKQNPRCKHLPISLSFSHSENVVVDSVTSINSMGFHTSFTFSSGITFVNNTITAPDESPNTDGIHISTTSNITITDSKIATGDDCIGIIQGTSKVEISNIECGPGHGISIGSLGKYKNEKDVTGVHVKNCTLTGTTNGARIKTFPGPIAIQASDIIFDGITMKDVANPIIIDQNYGVKNSATPSSVKVTDIHFRNIKGTTITDEAVSLVCSSLKPCDAIEMADIDLTYSGSKPFKAVCTNAKVTFTGKQSPPSCAAT